MPILIRSIGLLVLISTLALADDASEKALALNKEGTRLAEQRQFAAAIERFKSAETLLPRYQHHCNIGIAYQDSGKLPQALLFLQSCVARAGKNASAASKTRLAALEAKLKGAPWGTLTVTGERLRVAIAPWTDEEWIVDGQRSFVLEPGAVSILVKSRDASWTQPATITTGVVTTLALTPPVAEADQPQDAQKPITVPPVREDPAPDEPKKPPEVIVAAPVTVATSAAPWVVAGVGAGLILVGVVTYAIAAGQRSSFPATTPESELTGYRALVVTTYAAWGLGGAALAGGLLWGFFSRAPAPVTLAPSFGPHGEVLLSVSSRL